MKDDELKIRVRAYEKGRPKNALSDFENDVGFVDQKTLADLLDQFRDWVIDNLAADKGGVPTRDLNGGDIALRPESIVDQTVNCRNAILRPTARIRLYAYGGNVKYRKDISNGVD